MNGNQISSTPPDLWKDSVDCWRQLPNKALFFTLLAAWLALFHFFGNSLLGYVHSPSLLKGMYEAYNLPNVESDDGQGNFVPFLVVGLFWWKRKELLALPLHLWWPGLLILVAGMGLHLLGYAMQQPRLSVVALFTGIYGLMGLAWGREWLRKSIFPFFLFAFCVPLGGQAAFITFPLRLLVSWLVAVTAHLFGIDVVRMGTQLIDPTGTYQYDVAAACSGIRSLIAIFLLSTCYAFLTFHRASQRVLMILLAVPFAVLGNYLRLLLIIVAAELGGQAWGNYVHEGCPIHLPVIGEIAVVNLLPYLPAIVGLLLVGRRMEKWPTAGNPVKQERP